MIQAEHLTKLYGPISAIKDISFGVDKGEVMGFLGPNGAGKTTTMRILTCFLPPTGGWAAVAGFDVTEKPLEVRKRIGYLPEHVPLYNDMTVRAYLGFVAEVKGLNYRERRRAAARVVEDCGLRDVENRLIGHISKGYRQRVGLAQALINDPEVLILDEPTIGLDPAQIVEIRELIKNLAGDHTVILSTHILPEVQMTCSRVLIVNKGEVVAQGGPKELTERMQTSATISLEVEGPREKVIATLNGVPGVTRVRDAAGGRGTVGTYHVESRKDVDVRRELAAAVWRAGLGLLEMRPLQMSLEDVFVHLVTEEREEADGA
ncbi:MAG: ATP-binding cassette domain-containing protein [Nitrospinota bacterium]